MDRIELKDTLKTQSSNVEADVDAKLAYLSGDEVFISNPYEHNDDNMSLEDAFNAQIIAGLQGDVNPSKPVAPRVQPNPMNRQRPQPVERYSGVVNRDNSHIPGAIPTQQPSGSRPQVGSPVDRENMPYQRIGQVNQSPNEPLSEEIADRKQNLAAKIAALRVISLPGDYLENKKK